VWKGRGKVRRKRMERNEKLRIESGERSREEGGKERAGDRNEFCRMEQYRLTLKYIFI
jgi:hypothetical protein